MVYVAGCSLVYSIYCQMLQQQLRTRLERLRFIGRRADIMHEARQNGVP